MTLPNPIDYLICTGDLLLNGHAPYAYVMAQQGVVKVAECEMFAGSVNVAPGCIKGLPIYPSIGGVLYVPRIPFSLLATVLDHARRAGDVLTPVEQMYHFHWIEGQWRVSVPKQVATAGAVTYQGGNAPTIVMDLHSHHSMRAYFSPTDDRDEQGFRFYAVIGRIYEQPEIVVRLGVYGDFIGIPASTLFEGLGDVIDKGVYYGQ